MSSRTLIIEQTDRQTDICIYWAPVGAKKFLDNTGRKFKYLNFYFVVKFLFITPLVVKSREISKY